MKIVLNRLFAVSYTVAILMLCVVSIFSFIAFYQYKGDNIQVSSTTLSFSAALLGSAFLFLTAAPEEFIHCPSWVVIIFSSVTGLYLLFASIYTFKLWIINVDVNNLIVYSNLFIYFGVLFGLFFIILCAIIEAVIESKDSAIIWPLNNAA